ncbi:MAG: hypothetical protein HY360_11100 [Verrucomicrobia bacterium]|nr:hypothetical protein [Verrucomicrobiota bacterium]
MDAKTLSLLALTNPEWNAEARIVAASLPVPMNVMPPDLAGIATQSQDIAWWPDSQSGRKRAPRRRLIFGLSDGKLPRQFRLGSAAEPPRNLAALNARVRIVDEDLKCLLPHQVGEVVFRWKNRSLALRLGIRWREEFHWWQWLRIEDLWSGPLVKAVRIGGYIEVDPAQEREFNDPRSFYGTPRLHRHDWIFADVFALCFANGVVQITARHINNHRFDEGRDLQHVAPMLAFTPDRRARLDETLDGTRTQFQVGSASLNLDDAAPLVSIKHPGALRTENDLVLFQPYEGIEVGLFSDSYRVQSWEERMPKGVARTVRFHFSLSDVAPVVSRLVVPEWWYALAGDLWPGCALPVHDEWNKRLDRTYQVNAVDRRGRFDECVLGWFWEGETPYAELLHFYRSGQVEHWRRAIRDAYHIADIAFDHSTETIRMHDSHFNGWIAPPLFRTVGMTFGHLETGDPYLLDCSEAAASHWYWMDRLNWPRYAFGRDGSSIRSLIFLWDYTGKEDYRTMAREAIGRLIRTQDSDGSYPDQGGTTGLHAMGQVVRKPWMANMASDPILDYLLRGHDEPELWRAIEKTGEYLRKSFQRGKDGDYWPYQTSYGGANVDPWIAMREPRTCGRLPTKRNFAHGHKARLLSVLTRHSGRPEYFEMWLRFHQRHWASAEPPKDATPCIRSLQHLPFAQAHRWNAQWRNGEVCIDPLLLPNHRELNGTLITPAGKLSLKIRRAKNGWSIVARTGAAVRVAFKSSAEADAG